MDNTKTLIEKAHQNKIPVYYMLFTEQEGSFRAKDQPLWQVHPYIPPLESDRIIIKYKADSFLETDLNSFLQKEEITDLILTGLQTEYCVDTTVRSAFSHGYKVTLVRDAHSTFDSEIMTADTIIAHHNLILTQFADIIDTKDVNFI
ncbi:MAG TPA: isochorismatase family protein [Clostridia bacterium]|nr:isochorismatase family protein [Clostridia bacterium]HQM38736.1 isochorismatase family protein [Clostridia bacterium]